jgi:uncharacterized protein (TIGR03437 family)
MKFRSCAILFVGFLAATASPLAAQVTSVLTVTSNTLRFTATTGSSSLPAAQSLTVQSTPIGLGFTIATSGPAPHNGAWLLTSVNSGRAPQTLSVQVNPTGLAAGSYTATITLTATSGIPAPTATINVSLTVGTPPPTITVSPTALVFNYLTGQPIAGNSALSSTFILSNTGSATAATLSLQSTPWLRINPTGNITLAGLFNSISVAVDPTGLPPRSYSTNITIRSTAAANPTLTVPVTMNIIASPPIVENTWPLGVIAQSPQSIATLNGQNFFSNSTVTATGFTSEATITVSDGTNSSTESFFLPVYGPTATHLRINMGSPLPGGVVGVPYSSLPLQASGGNTPYSWIVASGALPPGLAIINGSLGGVPLAAGSYYFTLQVADATTPVAAIAYFPMKLTIMPSAAPAVPRITGPTAVIPTGTLNVVYPGGIGAIATGGSGPYTFSAANLPPGLAMSASTGIISGTPSTIGVTGNMTGRNVGETAMLVTVPASHLVTPGLLRMAVTTPAPGGGVSNEAQFQVFGPQPQVTAVVDSASYLQGTISPGQIITIFGIGLGPGTLTLFNPASPAPQIQNSLPATAPSTSVTINSTPAPVLYSSSNQVSVVVPYTLAGTTADLVLTYGGLTSQSVTLALAPTTPSIYTFDASGRGQGAILNFNPATSDYTLNSSSAPAARGSTIIIYMNGVGNTNLPVANTLIPASPTVSPTAPISVTIGGQAATVIGAASPIGSVPGLLQLNVTVPSTAPIGSAVPVVVNIGGNDSQLGVTMVIR